MIFKWIAHSCFQVTLSDGRRLVFDPFMGIGFDMPEVEADLLFMSHQHRDHNAKDSVKGRFKVFWEPGVFEEEGIRITGMETFHDKEEGARRGKNLVFLVEAEGVRFAHLGDLGHLLSEEQASRLSGLDVLMIPVGGNYTIGAEEAFELCKQIGPNIILPMHYKTPGLTVDVATLHGFIEVTSGYYDRSARGKNTLEFEAGRRKKCPRIVILDNSLSIEP